MKRILVLLLESVTLFLSILWVIEEPKIRKQSQLQ